MEKNNIENLVSKLDKNDYYELIKYLLGYKSFISTEKSSIQRHSDEKSGQRKIKNGFPKYLADEYVDKQMVNMYYVEKDDFEKKEYQDYKGNTYSIWDLINALDDNVVWNIVQGIVGKEDKELDEKHMLDGRKLFEQFRPESLNFILGAGINSGYDVGDWNHLILAMRNEIARINGTNSGSIRSFEEKMCNTNYIAPQILKDLNSSQYYNVIYDNLYGNYNATKLSRLTEPNIEDTNLYQVARILATQKGDATALTFNYDDIIEQVMANNYPRVTCSSRYCHSKNHKSKVEIIHSHGYYPYGGKPHSIVLSSYEYMEKYLYSNSYARKMLIAQLEKTNIIIGNSLADYEEQKVFFDNHKIHRSHFDFTFLKSSNEFWMNQYKTIYYLKMGVIPVFFKDFDEMNGYLKII